MTTFVVHYSEVALKGRNRPEFIRALRHNITRSLHDLEPKVSFRDGRFLVEVREGAEEAGERLGRVFGVSWFSEISAVPKDYSAILAEVLKQATGSSASTFRISPRRSDKSFSMTSGDLAAKLGAEVARQTGMKVNLIGADLDLHVDVISREVLVYSDKLGGPGGLPVGTAGRVMHLFSGGIDSPVAAWLLMKRGCSPVYLHFFLAPTPESALDSKITRLLKVLSTYGGRSTCVLVPFAEYQLSVTRPPDGLEPSLFRRFMRMTAERLAPVFRAGAIGTGDSLSQAASQTLWNLATFDEGALLPILRPLLTYDKEEVISLARRIGTYDLSIEEYKDCCAIITSHPQTRAKADLVSEFAKNLGFEDLVSRSLEHGTLVTWDPSTKVMKSARLAELLATRGMKDSSSGPTVSSSGTGSEAKI